MGANYHEKHLSTIKPFNSLLLKVFDEQAASKYVRNAETQAHLRPKEL